MTVGDRRRPSMTAHDLTSVYVVPHTHWDREWYEPAVRFRQRLVAAVDRVLELLEARRGLPVFLLDGQTVLIDDYLAVRPDARDRVARLVKAGQLLVGPWFILADELLPADETHVRNLLQGSADARALGGWLPLGYCPDAFGHPAALPTILAGFGIRNAIVWRGYGGERGEEGDLFVWQGADGSRVTVHHLPSGGYELGASLPSERGALVRRWEAIRAVLEPRAEGRALLLLAGADHHEPQADLPRVVDELGRLSKEHRFRIAGPQEYFASLRPRVRVPEVEGELRFSYRHAWTLQGVHATRARLKAAIRHGEDLLIRWAEPQAALAWLAAGTDYRPLLRIAWREHLLNCFHDTLSGTTADDVAREADVRARNVIHQARGLFGDAVHERLGQDRAKARRHPDGWAPTLVLVNPSPVNRSGVVEATVTVFEQRVLVGSSAGRTRPLTRRGTRPPTVVGADGKPIEMQVLGRYAAEERLDCPDAFPRQDRVGAFRVALRAKEVPALGMVALPVVEGTSGRGGRRGRGGRSILSVRVRRNRVVSDWCTVSADSREGFALEARDLSEALHGLAAIVSERDEGDTYTFEPVMGDEPRRAVWGKMRTVWTGPLVAAIARPFEVRGRARGMVYARLDAESQLVRFVVDGENLALQHRLRVVFPLPSAADSRVHIADMQYGPVLRLLEDYNLREFRREWPVATAPMHRYVSVPNGLTVFARDRYEYERTLKGTIAVTLFRAVGDLSRGDLAARAGHAGWPTPTPEAQELGPFRAEFAVATQTLPNPDGSTDRRMDGSLDRRIDGSIRSRPQLQSSDDPSIRRSVEVERLAEEFHSPVSGMMLRYGIDVPRSLRGPRLEGRGLVFKAAKPSEDGDGLVLRCVNVTMEPVRGVWVCPFRVKRVRLARLDESPVRDLRLAGGRRRIVFEARPREAVTVLVEWD